MKKISLLLITSIFVISCSQSNVQESQETPIVEYVWHSAGPDFNAENLAKIINEWNAIITNAELSNLVPKTYGYAQAKLYNHDVSLLFVDFLGLTLKNMFEEMTQERPGERELRLIAQTSKSVVEMLVNLSKNMLQAYDWHFGNIAFENKSTEGSTKLKGLKLIDWEGNGMANAQQTERGRMRDAFDAFRADFMKFEEHGYINSHDTSVKSIWSSAMQFMGEVLGTWWTGEDIESPLPNDENLQDLADRLKNAVEHFCSILRTEDMATDIGGFHCASHPRSGLTDGQETSNNQTVDRCDSFWLKLETNRLHREQIGFMRGEHGATTLAHRWSQHEAGISDAFPNGVPPQTRADGNDVKIILSLFIRYIKQEDYHLRIQKTFSLTRGWCLPLVLEDEDKMHADWWAKFTIDKNWHAVSVQDKKQHCYEWFHDRFMADSSGRNKARWTNFYLSSDELQKVVNLTFSQDKYRR